MRDINAAVITDAVRRMCIEANVRLPGDVCARIGECLAQEDDPGAKTILAQLEENASLAAELGLPICQDTGMACVFVELGQEVHITGSLREAVDAGVRAGYAEGYLRKSVVADPLERINTADNTPAMLYTELVPGDRLRITVAPKGFGSENMSAIKMLKPSDGVEGVKAFIYETVEKAGANPCPPIVVGVGLGGTFDKAALIAKKALLRELGAPSPNPRYAELERELLEHINRSGIGPAGFGGKTTALAVHIETLATHIAGLPCAVNLNCHVARHKTQEI